MKKKVFSFISFAAIAAVAGWNYNQNMNNVNLSDLALENVEALANGESGNGFGTLYGNEAGTYFCCSSGSNNCGAASC